MANFMPSHTMKNDLLCNSAPLTVNDVEMINNLATFRIEKAKAEHWSRWDVKFLIYDDTDLKTNGYDSDDEDAMLQAALQMSTANGSTEESEEGDQAKVKGGKGKAVIDYSLDLPGYSSKQHETPSPHCDTCSRCPEFPHHFKPTKFRLFRPRDEADLEGFGWSKQCCNHYLAVSYCWPPLKTDKYGNIIQEKGNYQIRDLDGTVRCSRALDDVLDRAVDVANSFGLRLIWISQECLPQPAEDKPLSVEDEEEQKYGIQAMDILYHRAVATAAFHSLDITSQAELDALMRPRDHRHDLDPLFNLLDKISKDRWYTRAWVVQEGISAGNSLALVFGRGPGISHHSRFILDQNYCIPPHSIHAKPDEFQSQVVCIPVDRFLRAVAYVNTLADQEIARMSFQSFDEYTPNYSHYVRVREIITRASALHPTFTHSTANPVEVFMNGETRSRDAVEGASALTLLKTRDCRDQKDFIAIMANMCGYEERLDPQLVAENCNSLRLALLTLALLNCDYSLLVPEIFDLPDGIISPVQPETSLIDSEPASTYQAISRDPPKAMLHWLHPFDTKVSSINYAKVHRAADLRVQIPIFINGRLQMHAYIWSVESEIDVSPIQAKWKDDWVRLKCITIKIEPLTNESEAEKAERTRKVALHFRNNVNMVQLQYELLEYGSPLRPESPLWGPISSDGILIIPYLNATLVESNPATRNCLGRIVVDLLRFLWNQGDTVPKAAEAANSIWQSLWAEKSYGEGIPELPDRVDEAFFQHPIILLDPFRALQFDRTREGSYSQIWLLDRIMSQGVLWVGRYVRSHNPMTYGEAVPNPLTMKKSESEPKLASQSNPSNTSLSRKRKYVSRDDGVEMAQIETAHISSLKIDQEALKGESTLDMGKSGSKNQEQSSNSPLHKEDRMPTVITGQTRTPEDGRRNINLVKDLIAMNTNYDEDQIPAPSSPTEAGTLARINGQPRPVRKRQLTRKQVADMIALVVNRRIRDAKEKFEDNEESVAVIVGRFIRSLELLTCGVSDFLSERWREHNLVSVFDVDGPCVVATPFNSMWERLPRPELRSMSVCWVIEPVAFPSGTALLDQNALEIPGVVHKHDGCRPEKRLDGIYLNHHEAYYDRYRNFPLSYRVLDKVKGMWQIMDCPTQSYIFI